MEDRASLAGRPGLAKAWGGESVAVRVAQLHKCSRQGRRSVRGGFQFTVILSFILSADPLPSTALSTELFTGLKKQVQESLHPRGACILMEGLMGTIRV